MIVERSSKAVAQAQAFLGVRFSLDVPVAFFSFTAKQSFTRYHLSIRACVRVKDQAGTLGQPLDPSNIGRVQRDADMTQGWWERP
jgi:hypothetical protein